MNILRRDFLVGAAGLTAASAVPASMRSAAPLLAVDRLEILVVVDGSVNPFAEPVRRPDLTVQPGGRGGFGDHRRTLAAEFGLSLAIRSHRGAEQRAVLLDAGYTEAAFSNNAELLGLEPSTIDAVVISHGHHDHFGGLGALVGDPRLRPGTPLRVGGEEAFCQRLRTTSAVKSSFGAIDRAAIARAGMRVEIEPLPAQLAGHGLTTGMIPLVSAERPKVPTRMLPGQGCERADLDDDKGNVDEVQDDMAHELGVVYHVRDRGLVVFGSCSHRGILNTIQQAQAASGIDRVHAVFGGFHLVFPQTPEDAAETAREMAILAPDYLVPGHCTGEPFIAAAEKAMPGRVIRPYVGSRFVLGDQS